MVIEKKEAQRVIGNTVNLCDSCQLVQPTCPSEFGDKVYGDGKGHDNVAACRFYLPAAAKKMDLEGAISKAAIDSIRDGITKTLVEGYNSPLSKFIGYVLDRRKAEFHSLIDGELGKILDSEDFKLVFRNALNEKLARLLVSGISGQLEKQVNELRANPATKAKITLAITNVVDELGKGS